MDIWNRRVWLKSKGRRKESSQKLLKGQGKVVRGFCLLCSQAEGMVPIESKRPEIQIRTECTYIKTSFRVLIVMVLVQSSN